MTTTSNMAVLVLFYLAGLVASQDDPVGFPTPPSVPQEDGTVQGEARLIQARPAPPPIGPHPPTGCLAGFSVRKADLNSLRFGSKLGFQDELTNIGGWSGNEFQAPCNGLYYFSFHAVSPQRGDFTLALMRGGTYQVTAYGSSNGYQQGSNSALLLLRAGERVYLELQQGTIYEHPFNEAYTSFSGFLVERY